MNKRTTLSSLVLPLLVGLAAAVLVPGFRTYRAERRELERERTALAKVADEARREERRARDAAAASVKTKDELDAAQARAANASATQGARFRWTQLVKEFRSRLAARTDVKIADFKLLTARDWLEAALNADGADDAKLNRVISAMRYTAQKRLGVALLDALHRWIEANGKLPPDPSALLPLLPANIDAAMLSRFSMARTGAVEPRDQPVLQENEGAFAPLRLTVDGWNMNRKVSVNEGSAADENLEDLARVVDEDVGWMMAGLRGYMEVMPKSMEAVVGENGTEELGQDMKQAAAKYWALHGNKSPETVADVMSHLQHGEKLITAMTEVVATLQYVTDHEGMAPPNRAVLQPYVAALKDPNAVLRLMKLKYDGDQVTFSFEFNR